MPQLEPLKIRDAEKARELCHKNLSPRYRRLDNLEAYVECRQYDGRTPWEDASEKPLREREPPVKYPTVWMAIESNNDWVMGEGRWPNITSFASEDDTSLDPDFGLSKEQSETLDGVISHVVKQSRFVTVITEALSAAQACGTAVTIYSVRRGRLCGETVRSKWCFPKFSEENPQELEELDIRYPYVDEQQEEKSGEWVAKCLWFRRLITKTEDIHFLPADATEDDTEPKWAVDHKRSKKHDLGFCPAIWFALLKPVSATNQIDGTAIHERRFELIERLDFALSQKDRAAFYCGDPQLVETGVPKDEEPAEQGRQQRTITNSAGFSATVPTGKAVARKRGAATVWRYTDPAAKAFYLTLGADALKALDDNARDLRAKLQEALNVIFIDPDHVKYAAEFSNKALRTLLKRQLSHCDKIRQNMGDELMIPSICMMLRIAYTVNSRKPGSVYLPGLDKAMPILARYERDIETEDGQTAAGWFNPHVDLKWGPYFEPDALEEQQIATSIVQLFAAKLITRQTAIERLPESYGINNAAEYAKTVEDAEQGEHDRQLELMHAMNSATGENEETGGRRGGPNQAGPGGNAAGGVPAKAKARTRGGAAAPVGATT